MSQERLPGLGNIPLIGGASTIVRQFRPDERFPIPIVYEPYMCDDATGSFIQLGQPIHDWGQAQDFIAMLAKNPDMVKSKSKLFLARVDRYPVIGNFNSALIGPPPAINLDTAILKE